jgi:hypothetical protein
MNGQNEKKSKLGCYERLNPLGFSTRCNKLLQKEKRMEANKIVFWQCKQQKFYWGYTNDISSKKTAYI